MPRPMPAKPSISSSTPISWGLSFDSLDILDFALDMPDSTGVWWPDFDSRFGAKEQNRVRQTGKQEAARVLLALSGGLRPDLETQKLGPCRASLPTACRRHVRLQLSFRLPMES